MKKETWKITIEQYGCKYSLELDHADVNVEEVYNALKQILACSGWSECLVKQILNEDEV
jgi:hypothetical protein